MNENSRWSCKLIICKRITEHTYWSVDVWLTCHIKFYMCCDCMPFIDRPDFWSYIFPWWVPGGKAHGSSKYLVLWNNLLWMKLIKLFFSKILPKIKFNVNFCIQLYAFLTHEDPVYLQITYLSVYYVKYTELKYFFGHWVWAPKPYTGF